MPNPKKMANARNAPRVSLELGVFIFRFFWGVGALEFGVLPSLGAKLDGQNKTGYVHRS
jgi:hypothetical protein